MMKYLGFLGLHPTQLRLQTRVLRCDVRQQDFLVVREDFLEKFLDALVDKLRGNRVFPQRFQQFVVENPLVELVQAFFEAQQSQLVEMSHCRDFLVVILFEIGLCGVVFLGFVERRLVGEVFGRGNRVEDRTLGGETLVGVLSVCFQEGVEIHCDRMKIGNKIYSFDFLSSFFWDFMCFFWDFMCFYLFLREFLSVFKGIFMCFLCFFMYFLYFFMYFLCFFMYF